MSEPLTSVKTFVAIWITLLVLTGVTVGVAQLNLGALSVAVALIIAVIKASLVALFFIVAIACQQLGSNCLVSPALAAWAPLMIFVPAAVGMSSAMWER